MRLLTASMAFVALSIATIRTVNPFDAWILSPVYRRRAVDIPVRARRRPPAALPPAREWNPTKPCAAAGATLTSGRAVAAWRVDGRPRRGHCARGRTPPVALQQPPGGPPGRSARPGFAGIEHGLISMRSCSM